MSDPARRLSLVKGGGGQEPPMREGPEDDVQLTLMDHLQDLRKRIIYSVYAIVAAFSLTYYYNATILEWVLRPVRAAIPAPGQLTLSAPIEGFLVSMRVAGYSAVALTFPFLLYQLYQFVAPGLYRRERRLIVPFVSLGLTFFVLGGLFARYLILPFALEVLITGYATPAPTPVTPTQEAFVNVANGGAPSGARVQFGAASADNAKHVVQVTVNEPGPVGKAKLRVVVDGEVKPDVPTDQPWIDPDSSFLASYNAFVGKFAPKMQMGAQSSGLVLAFDTGAGAFAKTDVFTNAGLMEHLGSGHGLAYVLGGTTADKERGPLKVALAVAQEGTSAKSATDIAPLDGAGTARGTLTLSDEKYGTRTFSFDSGSFPATFTDGATGAIFNFNTLPGRFAAGDVFSVTVLPQTQALSALLSIDQTSDFVMMVLLAFGIIFQLPLILSLLARLGIVSSAFLRKHRRIAIVGNVFLAAVITPTGDPLNLSLMALPLCVFYEMGILGAVFMESQRKDGDGLRMKDDPESET